MGLFFPPLFLIGGGLGLVLVFIPRRNEKGRLTVVKRPKCSLTCPMGANERLRMVFGVIVSSPGTQFFLCKIIALSRTLCYLVFADLILVKHFCQRYTFFFFSDNHQCFRYCNSSLWRFPQSNDAGIEG